MNNNCKYNFIRIAGVTKYSVVDGPGLRYVIFTQGCLHFCNGCHNTVTHSLVDGLDVDIEELFNEINNTRLIKGITISGGEPFLQPDACAALCRLIKTLRKDLDIVVYTGYYYSDLILMAKYNQAISDILSFIDILVDGPYEKSLFDPNLPFRGSSNQNLIYLNN